MYHIRWRWFGFPCSLPMLLVSWQNL